MVEQGRGKRWISWRKRWIRQNKPILSAYNMGSGSAIRKTQFATGTSVRFFCFPHRNEKNAVRNSEKSGWKIRRFFFSMIGDCRIFFSGNAEFTLEKRWISVCGLPASVPKPPKRQGATTQEVSHKAKLPFLSRSEFDKVSNLPYNINDRSSQASGRFCNIYRWYAGKAHSVMGGSTSKDFSCATGGPFCLYGAGERGKERFLHREKRRKSLECFPVLCFRRVRPEENWGLSGIVLRITTSSREGERASKTDLLHW